MRREGDELSNHSGEWVISGTICQNKDKGNSWDGQFLWKSARADLQIPCPPCMTFANIPLTDMSSCFSNLAERERCSLSSLPLHDVITHAGLFS